MQRVLLLAALVLAAGVAQADNGLLYLGAGVVRDRVSDIAATNSDLNSTSWKVLAGFRPISMFAVEADYIDLGSQTTNFVNVSSHVEYKSFAGYAVGYAPIPVPFVDVFGKLGLARWSSSGGALSPGSSFFSLSDNGTEFAWGAGAQLHAGNLGGRLEYESFHIRNTNGANVISLSVILSLL
jgi:Outer membrane protein beta-barrel domain